MTTSAPPTSLSSTFDYLRGAQRLNMRASSYWRSHIAPYLADPKSSLHVCRTLKQRVLWDIKDLIPRSVEASMFNALLKDPASTAHTGRPIRAEYGVSREYVAVRLLGYFERHIAAGGALPYPLGTYLAVLIPNRVSDETVARLVASGEFPHTLAGFKRTPEGNAHQTAALKLAGRQHRAACAAKGAKRWAGEQAAYLDTLAQRRDQQFAAHAAYLTSTPAPSLKAFAKYLVASLPADTSKRMPNPVAVMAYTARALRSRIPAQTYNDLHAQATAYATGQPQQVQEMLAALA